MEANLGPRAVVWGAIGTELMGVVYDLRYMILCSVALILADLWWGYSESSMKYEKAKEKGDKAGMEKHKWHKSRAGRRTTNKLVDYMTYLVVGALIGLAITEPMDICSHVWTAALGLGIGCACEIASIIGHIAYVKMEAEISMVDGWRLFVKFLGRIIRIKSVEIGDAVESLGEKSDEPHHRRHRENSDGNNTILDHDDL